MRNNFICMKKSLLTLTLVFAVFIIVLGQSQENIKIGGYRSMYEFIQNSPSIDSKFIIEKRTDSDIEMYGGNDYKVTSTNKEVPLGEIKKRIWGIYDGTSLYINGFHYSGYNWYSKAEIVGKLIYLKIEPPLNKNKQKIIGYKENPYNYNMFGAIGGAIVSAIESSRKEIKRIPILLNLESKNAVFLTRDRMFQLISEFPDLKRDYLLEIETDNEEIVKKYINRLNSKNEFFLFSANSIDQLILKGTENRLKEINDNLYRIDSNITFQDYYAKVLNLSIHPMFENVEIIRSEYSNGELHSIGLRAKHNLDKSKNDTYSDGYNSYKIGTWRYFYENGQPKVLVDFDLMQKKNGRCFEYDQSGRLIKDEFYISGKIK